MAACTATHRARNSAESVLKIIILKTCGRNGDSTEMAFDLGPGSVQGKLIPAPFTQHYTLGGLDLTQVQIFKTKIKTKSKDFFTKNADLICNAENSCQTSPIYRVNRNKLIL